MYCATIELTAEEVQTVLQALGYPEDSFDDPAHPARTAKEKLLAYGEQIETDQVEE